MAKLYSSVACNLDATLLAACYPLLAEAKVEAIEWSFDALYKRNEIPDWFSELLRVYGKEGRLTAHGVFFSLFSGRWKDEQAIWLQLLQKTSREFQFDHVTEHFGFMTGRDFHHGAPLNIPYNATTLAIGRDRLARIQDACSAPVGLENLAFSYCLDDVKRHGAFLEQLIAPVNGFIILDLHNLYCQLHNFSLDFETLVHQYPLDRVREIHISGGSWQPHRLAPGLNVRRDTHDDGVPNQVFEMLRMAIPLCPNLKFVVMEQLGAGLMTSESRTLFYDDFVTMQQLVNDGEQSVPYVEKFLPVPCRLPAIPLSDELLHQQQLELSGILETAMDVEEAMTRLSLSSLAHSDWKIEDWRPYMLDAAIEIAKKWKR